MEPQIKRLIIITIITLSMALNVLLAVLYTLNWLELRTANQQLQVRQVNEKSLYFAKLFVDNLLLGSGTVGFEDRLRLENAVRDINNPEIFSQWQTFTNSANDGEAQKAAGKLLNLLLDTVKK